MDAMGICELERTDADFDDMNRDLLLCQQALTHDRVRKIGRTSIRRQTLRVLVIGEKQETTDELVKLVRRWGHGARGAVDGLTALRVAAAQHPNVVLLKMDMPLMNGCQVASHLRVDFPRKKCLIIALTGRADGERRQQCREAGIDLLLVQPVDPAVLETLLMLESVLVNRSRVETITGFAHDEQT